MAVALAFIFIGCISAFVLMIVGGAIMTLADKPGKCLPVAWYLGVIGSVIVIIAGAAQIDRMHRSLESYSCEVKEEK